MDYEKKYKVCSGSVKESKFIEVPFGAQDSELKGWEYIIPEGMEAEIKNGKVIVRGKESEDERIRKALLRCCDDWEKGQFGCMKAEDVPAIRAYLEKQKEQKSIEDVIKNITKNKEAATEFLKSAGIMNDNGELAEMYRSEQKPLSTEETELNSIAFLEQLGYTCVPPGVKQKPAEWSKEDEGMIRFYEMDYNNQIGDWPTKKVVEMRLAFKDWLCVRLKSLRPQPHWKPSKEQMEALKYALGNDGKYDKEELESLLNDLKKL